MSESSYQPYPFAARHGTYGYGPNWEHGVTPYPNDAYYNNKTYDVDYWKDDCEENANNPSTKQQTGFDESNIDPTFFTDPSMVNPSATFQLDFFKKKAPSDGNEMFRRAERYTPIQPNPGYLPKYGASSVNDDDDCYSESSQSPSSSYSWMPSSHASYVNDDGITPNSSKQGDH
ncbi:3538_t:CDS:1 [Acaulospora colombiana]|uniref:3538_t:CDS:1 n=1 Tax=Acaulospora colombiana TaxID=27376 RepID=A0ACA9N184_9GLOM|nr:3538_t:CDS:1 [Acaulospora colombiana]